MFEVGFTEILLILGLALLVLGPEKLPGLAQKVGRWTGRARAMARQLHAQLEQEVTLEELSRSRTDRKTPGAQEPPATGAAPDTSEPFESTPLEPTQVEPTQVEPTQATEPIQAAPAQPASASSESARSAAGQAGSGQTDAGHPDSARAEPAQPSPSPNDAFEGPTPGPQSTAGASAHDAPGGAPPKATP